VVFGNRGRALNDSASAILAALDAGLNTEALDLARRAAPSEPDSDQTHYLGALASARMGAIGEAEKWLARIDRERLGDSAIAADFWSLAGRIAKERYSTAGDKTDAAARALARTAVDYYRRAFGIRRSAYPAVNAATMASLSGDALLARALAHEALSAPGTADDHWQQASAGEARLILGEIDAARAHYAEAHRLAANRFGDIASMRRQLLLIGSSAALGLLEAVPAPRVIAFSGHMIDHPARAAPRFPAELEPKVAAALGERLARLGPSVGYAQAACGSDILFLEAMQDAGMQTQVVLPCVQADFMQASVSIAGSGWCSRFERALARATRVVLATEEAFLGEQVLFEHTANLIQGMAFLRARELSTQPLLLTVCEPGSPAFTGGTSATTQIWTGTGGRVDNIDLAMLRGGAPQRAPDPGHAAVTPAVTSAAQRSLKSMLFADISGFTRLPEQHTPGFAEMFLRIAKGVLDSLQHPAVDANTRGDGLFITFERPAQAAEFAVRLLEALDAVDWASFGLAPDTGVRIGLHTGPVYGVFDPVMSKTTFYGSHVNLAARLEPIVQPGHILATEAFAASLIAGGEGRFRCDYVGLMPLAKQFGEARLYRLHT